MIHAVQPRVLVADPLSAGGLELLRSGLEVLVPETDAEIDAEIGASEALIVRSRTRVTADLLDRGRRLRLVGRAGIGVDNIDVDAATDRGILVINSPLGNVRSTAEHTVSLLFALARSVPAADRATRAGRWKQGYTAVQLLGKRLGIIGIGKVGRQVAAMATGIGMEVVAYDPYLPDSAWKEVGVRRVGFDELLAGADFVSIHVPKGPDTRNLIGAVELGRMRPGSYLINCARGGLVDETAVASALEAGHLAGAAVDVYAQEPVTDSPLLAAPNTILTPHVAASAREAQAQVSTDIAAQVLDFFAGRPVSFPVNPTVLREDIS